MEFLRQIGLVFSAAPATYQAPSSEGEVIKVEASELLEALRANFKNLVFRKINRVECDPKFWLETRVYQDDQTFKSYEPDKEPGFSNFEMEHNVEHRYSSFQIFTSENAKYENDPYNGTAIHAYSNRYGFPNMLDENTGPLWRFPFSTHFVDSMVLPRVGDLVCGLPAWKSGKPRPTFKFWFVCSEQFHRMWAAIMYKTAPVLETRGDKPDDIRRYLFTGNRLCTANYRKWLLGHEQNSVPVNEDEKKKRYYRYRTEGLSRQYVHIYAALVLLARYNELPSKANLTKVLDNSPNVTQWDLPRGWLEMLMKKYNITEVGAAVVKIPERRPSKRDSSRNQSLPNLEDETQFPVLVEKDED